MGRQGGSPGKNRRFENSNTRKMEQKVVIVLHFCLLVPSLALPPTLPTPLPGSDDPSSWADNFLTGLSGLFNSFGSIFSSHQGISLKVLDIGESRLDIAWEQLGLTVGDTISVTCATKNEELGNGTDMITFESATELLFVPSEDPPVYG